MRHLPILIMLAALATPALAARRVTVQQLESLLTASHGKSDEKIAQQLYDLELTERLSTGRLARYEADLSGPQAREALIAVADASAFLDLPAADLPATPAPDRAAQSAMLALTMNYAKRTIDRLPNFFATRETTRFEDTPSQPPRNTTDTIRYEPLHKAGTSAVTVLYRNGQEFVDTGAKRQKVEYSDRYLSSSGEFGPILATVLADAAKSGVAWSHWETNSAGTFAVFNYKVSQQDSHYTINLPGTDRDTKKVPGYHGEIGIDPLDGSILRLTMVAELKSTDPVTRTNLSVEYGPVEIGGQVYICPVKSVASSLVRITTHNAVNGDEWTALGPLQIRVNDVVFTKYHLFRAEARILTGDSPVQDPNQQAPGLPAPSSAPAANPHQ
jgi:hypothetical protein